MESSTVLYQLTMSVDEAMARLKSKGWSVGDTDRRRVNRIKRRRYGLGTTEPAEQARV